MRGSERPPLRLVTPDNQAAILPAIPVTSARSESELSLHAPADFNAHLHSVPNLPANTYPETHRQRIERRVQEYQRRRETRMERRRTAIESLAAQGIFYSGGVFRLGTPVERSIETDYRGQS